MIATTYRRAALSAVAVFGFCALVSAPAAAQSLTSLGVYAENFDSIGSTATRPAGWAQFNLTGANSTFTNGTGIPAASVGGGTAAAAPVVNNAPTANQNNGYNAQRPGGPVTDRVLATAPTGNAAAVLQLTLTNNTGADITAFQVSYDIVRFTTATTGGVATDNELPGYQLFYSVDNGTSFFNVASLNPVISASGSQPVVPNTPGVTPVSSTAPISLFANVANGDNFILRWVDDNATQTSPDQIIGLDNVVVTNAPEASSLLLCGFGLFSAATVAAVRKRRAA